MIHSQVNIYKNDTQSSQHLQMIHHQVNIIKMIHSQVNIYKKCSHLENDTQSSSHLET